MIRLGRYHLIAALGLMLAYNGIAGMIASMNHRELESLQLPDGLPAAPWQPAATEAGPAMDPDLGSGDSPALMIAATALPPSVPAPAIQQSSVLEAGPVESSNLSQIPPIPPQPQAQADQLPATGLDPAAETAAGAAPPSAQPTLEALSEAPVRIVIPAIGLAAPVVPARARSIEFRGQSFQQWLAPAFFAAGWHSGSAPLGSPGNTVLNGHHNIDGKVFGKLVDLEIGDRIQVYSDRHLFIYQITNRMIVPEKYQQMDTRMANAQWILPSQDERLTLITCWPDETNTHRVIIVAVPIERQALNP